MPAAVTTDRAPFHINCVRFMRFFQVVQIAEFAKRLFKLLVNMRNSCPGFVADQLAHARNWSMWCLERVPKRKRHQKIPFISHWWGSAGWYQHKTASTGALRVGGRPFIWEWGRVHGEIHYHAFQWQKRPSPIPEPSSPFTYGLRNEQ